MREIYLDYNASTPIDPVVATAMRPLLKRTFGNPSSGHWAGTAAKIALENARREVAGLLGCAADEVIFTSGGSEANNLALKGVFFALKDKGHHIVTSAIEHPATIMTCKFLERLGADVRRFAHVINTDGVLGTHRRVRTWPVSQLSILRRVALVFSVRE